MGTGDETPTEVTPLSTERDDGFDFDLDGELPPPPRRRRRLPLVTAVLTLCAAVGAGVVFGILIQKHWGGSGGSSAGGRAASFAAAFAGRTGQTGGAAGGRAAGGFASSGTTGQVKAIDGTTLYLTDFQGNTVKVTTGPGVRVRVTSDGTLKRISPGDYVVVQGAQTASGYKATSITDSGTESPFAGGFGATRGGGSNGGQQSGGTTTTTTGAGNVPVLPGLGG